MWVKSSVKRLLDLLLGSPAVYAASTCAFRRPLFPYVLAVTYHDTPRGSEASLRRQFEWYRKHFVGCTPSDLRNLLYQGTWRSEKPGLIVSFDDGLRSNFDVALPLLEEYGFTGWFMVPPAFVDTDPSEQMGFAQRNLIDFGVAPKAGNGRIAMSWEELRNLIARGHAISCHSMTHKRLADDLSDSELNVEICASRELLESRLGAPVGSFTWVGGEEWAYGLKAHECVTRAGYDFVFCTNCAPVTARQSPWFLQRYHVDPADDLYRIRSVLGGSYDLLYFPKRRRIDDRLCR